MARKKRKQPDPCESCVFFLDCGQGVRCSGYYEMEMPRNEEYDPVRDAYRLAWFDYAFDDDDCYP